MNNVSKPINSSGMHPRLRFSDTDRQRINCFGYALGINLGTSARNLIKRRAFLQVLNFSRMVRNSLQEGNNLEAMLCQKVWTEVARMGKLNTSHGVIPLLRTSRPNMRNITGAYTKLGIVPAYYKIAIFVAPDKTGNGNGADFHFAREYARGKWTHKAGGTAASEVDTDGYQLHPVHSAKHGRLRVGLRGPRYQFCTYMWCVSIKTRMQLARALNLGRYKDALIKALEDSV